MNDSVSDAVSETPEKPRVGTGLAGPGRPKGVPNKTTHMLREAILIAASEAGGGGEHGLKDYLLMIAQTEPKAFTSLLGKVLPLQVTGGDGGPIVFERIVREVVDPKA